MKGRAQRQACSRRGSGGPATRVLTFCEDVQYTRLKAVILRNTWESCLRMLHQIREVGQAELVDGGGAL